MTLATLLKLCGLWRAALLLIATAVYTRAPQGTVARLARRRLCRRNVAFARGAFFAPRDLQDASAERVSSAAREGVAASASRNRARVTCGFKKVLVREAKAAHHVAEYGGREVRDCEGDASAMVRHASADGCSTRRVRTHWGLTVRPLLAPERVRALRK